MYLISSLFDWWDRVLDRLKRFARSGESRSGKEA